MRARHGLAYALLTLACGAAVLFASGPAAIAGGLLLALVLPGFAVTEFVLRGRTLARVERAVLAPALSLAVLVVAGLIIYVAGIALHRTAWTVATVGVTLLALAGATAPKSTLTLYTRIIDALVDEDEKSVKTAPAPEPETRALMEAPEPVRSGAGTGRAVVVQPLHTSEGDEGGLPGEETMRIVVPPRGKDDTLVIPAVVVEEQAQANVGRPAVERTSTPSAVKPPRPLVWQLAPLLLVVGLLGGASWLSYDNSRDSYATTVTALSAEPSGPLDSDGNRSVVVGVTGLVAADGPYTLSTTGSTSAATTTRTIAVNEAGTWSQSLTLPGAQRITVTLRRAGETAAFRTLYLSAVE